MALQGQVRPRIGELSNIKKKKKSSNIDNLRNGVYTAIGEMIMI